MNIEEKDVSGALTPTPTFTERSISGTARVQNNRTMMLASVTTNIDSEGRSGIPVLSGLPILGRFFTAPTHDNRQVDIVISVTPRVLRAPAVTPRDEEMRPSGTLQSPTTGSLEAMLVETEREDKIAAARRIPKEVVVQLPDAPAYVPAPATATQTAANTAAAKQNPAPPANTVAQNKDVTPAPDPAMPQPKAAASSGQSYSTAPKTMDVASAIKNVVTPATDVSATSANAKVDVNVTPPVEDLAPKSEPIAAAAKDTEPAPSVIELRLTPAKGEMTVGEKRQLAVELSSDAPLGLVAVMLRFDPN